MDKKEKILFAYPTLLREGMSASKPYPPDSLIVKNDISEKNTIIVTASLLLLNRQNSYVTIDTYLNGEVITQDDDKSLNGFLELISDTPIDQEKFIITSAMHVENIPFTCSGNYEMRIRLFSKDGPEEKNVIDSLSCFICVIVGEGK